jgi:hypothetical protein
MEIIMDVISIEPNQDGKVVVRLELDEIQLKALKRLIAEGALKDLGIIAGSEPQSVESRGKWSSEKVSPRNNASRGPDLT